MEDMVLYLGKHSKAGRNAGETVVEDKTINAVFWKLTTHTDWLIQRRPLIMETACLILGPWNAASPDRAGN
jgi:hypothetical protein